jgi:predicted DNA-binding ribbon-helix-helix protein
MLIQVVRRPARGNGCRGGSQHLEKPPAFGNAAGMADQPMGLKRSVRIAGHATSLSLEPAFWDALDEIARHRGVSLNTLIAAIDAERSGSLSSAARVFVLHSCRRGELAGTGTDSAA